MRVRRGPAPEGEKARPLGLVARPHWWVVLAVSLALMALVASLSSATRGAALDAGGAARHVGRRITASGSTSAGRDHGPGASGARTGPAPRTAAGTTGHP
ncbi:MAG: hypothetical protein ACRDZR_09835, partial [Acidimicrobiales bacterium]